MAFPFHASAAVAGVADGFFALADGGAAAD